MNILLIFIDMFRPNLTKTWNPDNKQSKVDELLSKWGGTVYTNCFSPAPDTPRSNGCLWSSIYPLKNGCNTRIKYPRYYLHKPTKNFLREFLNHGYKMNFIINPCNERIGELPEDYRDVAFYSDGRPLKIVLDDIKTNENTITYISIKDYHFIVDDWRARPEAVEKADENISRQLELIDSKLNIRLFDAVVLFSDHGWTMSTEKYHRSIEQIGDNRDKILMYIRNKDDNALAVDDRLCSIMDVGPTLAEMSSISLPYIHDGLSLLSNDMHDCLLVEDHKDFNVSLSQTIEIWGVRYRNGRFICRRSDGCWETNGEQLGEEEIKDADRFFRTNGSFYEENIQAGMIINRYKDLGDMTTYYDGTPREKHIKLKTRIKETLLHLLR